MPSSPSTTGTTTSAAQNASPGKGQRTERAEHVDRTVGEVHHPQHAEDDGQAEGNQSQKAPPDQAVENVLQHQSLQSADGARKASAAGMVLSTFT